MFDPRRPTFAELTRQALSATAKGYDLFAPKFDYTPFRTPDELLEPMVGAIGPPGSIESALDACCGTGAAMAVLRSLCTSPITGIDLSAGMLAEAERQLASSSYTTPENRLFSQATDNRMEQGRRVRGDARSY